MSQSELVKEAVEESGARRQDLLPVLQYIVNKESFLSPRRVEEVAEAMDLSAAQVYGVASFYSFLSTEKLGKNIIRICKTITCYMKGKDRIIKAIENELNIKLGETTPDGEFSFLPTNCIGWCHKGPAMLINDRVYTEVTPQEAVQAIKEHREGKE
ncbi:MAG: NAD(P)H-dependent oxidoreductase subunit E [bacterium]